MPGSCAAAGHEAAGGSGWEGKTPGHHFSFCCLPSRSSLKGSVNAEEAKPGVEALKRLEDQRRRRGENESEELEKLKEKQQEAAAELDELKKRREERRKILEEEEQKKKQEEAERKIREEVSVKYGVLDLGLFHYSYYFASPPLALVDKSLQHCLVKS